MGAPQGSALAVARSLLEGLGDAGPGTSAAVSPAPVASAPADDTSASAATPAFDTEDSPRVQPVMSSNRSEVWRVQRLDAATRARRLVDELAKDWRRERAGTPESREAFLELRDGLDEAQHIDDDVKDSWVPQHSPLQLISPQHLLMSSVFSAKGRQVPREREARIVFARTSQGDAVYEGPELRQGDGLVMMGLVNMVRDLRVGTLVEFDPAQMCSWLFRRYDGPNRLKLRDSIQRLQKALLKYPAFSVHLVERFDYPSHGSWRVRLEPSIVRLFQQSLTIWLDLKTRQALPEGLTTWLLGYVESQTNLIPTSLEHLRGLSGSETKDIKSFRVVLTRSLNCLVAAKVVDCDWRFRADRVHWRKCRAVGGPRPRQPRAGGRA